MAESHDPTDSSNTPGGPALDPLLRRSCSRAIVLSDLRCVAFAAFSPVVKVVEQEIFGTWDHGRIFHVFQGSAAHVIGWSLADGLVPLATFFGLRVPGRWIPGLVVL